eukprot:14247708-Alexandrium_andersonii.AAC.1
MRSAQRLECHRTRARGPATCANPRSAWHEGKVAACTNGLRATVAQLAQRLCEALTDKQRVQVVWNCASVGTTT